MYNHKQIEEQIFDFWSKEKIFNKIKDMGTKPFYFSDGPPYATGQIHPGTAWNKSLKDAYCRFKRMSGYKVRAKAGFDTHGLPIEVKVEKQMGIKSKKQIEELGIEKFIDNCKSFATKYVGIMSNQFKKCGVWLDFDDPYITYKDSFIEKTWKTIALAHEKELLTKDYYVVPYCTRCETTLANYELEYGDETDPSIFVKFKLKNEQNKYLVVWTTTPWTLVSNMGVMVHPKFRYVELKIDDEIWIVAKDRVEYLTSLFEKNPIILSEFSGKDLEKKEYEHPLSGLIDKELEQIKRKVVLSDEFVTLEEGTGLVHTAPGHGPQDFVIGKRYGLNIVSPVDAQGNYTSQAGKYTGMYIKKANPIIIEDLKQKGLLVFESKITHRYPHCWRCKTPLIFVANDQWFIKISKKKQQMLDLIKDKTEWNPQFAKERFLDFIEKAPDWCISRQRYWGIPLPIWKCDECNHIKVIGSKDELPNHGSDLRELHRPYIDRVVLTCEKCGAKMHRIKDVLDVWFDSGNVIWAQLNKQEENDENFKKADLILEGQDQIRGWFYSLLGSGVVRYNDVPYKQVVMHGFFNDEKGEKMSKSVGNFIPLEEILEKVGADAFRLWGLSAVAWEDVKFIWNDLIDAKKILNIYFNISTYISRFYTSSEWPELDRSNLKTEDLWILSKTNSFIKNANKEIESYNIHNLVRLWKQFIVEDLSRTYLKLIKKRHDQNAWFCVFNAYFKATTMLNIISPFLSEYVYQNLFKKFIQKPSLAMVEWPKEDVGFINEYLEQEMEFAKEISINLNNLRQQKSIKLRWPLWEAVVLTKSNEIKKCIQNFSDVIKKNTNIKNIRVEEEFFEDPTYSKAEFDGYTLFLKTEITPDLYSEAMLNEVSRRIQILRKEANLREEDKINLFIHTDSELKQIIEKKQQELMKIVNAEKIEFKELDKAKKWTIDKYELYAKIQVLMG